LEKRKYLPSTVIWTPGCPAFSLLATLTSLLTKISGGESCLGHP
jgi:hypothetical protein